MSEMSLNIGAELEEPGSIVKSTDLFEPDSLEEGLLPTVNKETSFVTMEALVQSVKEMELLRDNISRTGGMTRSFAMEALQIDDNILNTPPAYFTEEPSAVQYNESMESLANGIASRVGEGVSKAYRMIKEALIRFREMIENFMLKGLGKLADIAGFEVILNGEVVNFRKDLSLDKRIYQIWGADQVKKYLVMSKFADDGFLSLKNEMEAALDTSIEMTKRLIAEPDSSAMGALVSKADDQQATFDKINNTVDESSEKEVLDRVWSLLTKESFHKGFVQFIQGLRKFNDKLIEADIPQDGEAQSKLSGEGLQVGLAAAKLMSTVMDLTRKLLSITLQYNATMTIITERREKTQASMEAFGSALSMEEFVAPDVDKEMIDAHIAAQESTEYFKSGLYAELDELQSMREQAAVAPDEQEPVDVFSPPAEEPDYSATPIFDGVDDVPVANMDETSMEAGFVDKAKGLGQFAAKTASNAASRVKAMIEKAINWIKQLVIKAGERIKSAFPARLERITKSKKGDLQKMHQYLGEKTRDNGNVRFVFSNPDMLNQIADMLGELSRIASEIKVEQPGNDQEVERLTGELREKVDAFKENKGAKIEDNQVAELGKFVAEKGSDPDYVQTITATYERLAKIQGTLEQLKSRLDQTEGEAAARSVGNIMNVFFALAGPVMESLRAVDAIQGAWMSYLDEQSSGEVSQEAFGDVAKKITDGAKAGYKRMMELLRAFVQHFKAMASKIRSSLIPKIREDKKIVEDNKEALKKALDDGALMDHMKRTISYVLADGSTSLIKVFNQGDIVKLIKTATDDAKKAGDFYKKYLDKVSKGVDDGQDQIDQVIARVDYSIAAAADFRITTMDLNAISSEQQKDFYEFMSDMANSGGRLDEFTKAVDEYVSVTETMLVELEHAYEETYKKVNPEAANLPGLLADTSKLRKAVADTGTTIRGLSLAMANATFEAADFIERGKLDTTRQNAAGEWGNDGRDMSQESYLDTYSQEGFGIAEGFKAGVRRLIEMIKALLKAIRKMWRSFSDRAMSSTVRFLVNSKILAKNGWTEGVMVYFNDPEQFERLTNMVGEQPALLRLIKDPSIINRVLIPYNEVLVRQLATINKTIVTWQKEFTSSTRNATPLELTPVKDLEGQVVFSPILKRAADEFGLLFKPMPPSTEQISRQELIERLDKLKTLCIDKKHFAAYLTSLEKVRAELANLPELNISTDTALSPEAESYIGENVMRVQEMIKEAEVNLRQGYSIINRGTTIIKRLEEFTERKSKDMPEVDSAIADA